MNLIVEKNRKNAFKIRLGTETTFKAIGFRCGISEKVLDAIVGHAPASVGRGYGEPTLADKAQELRKFPRYKRAG
jgi:hypothetical protein